MKTLLFVLFISIVTFACTPYRYLDKHHAEICGKCIDEYAKDHKDSTMTIKHDTVFVDVSENLHDTTLVYLKCDSLGNVLLVTVKKLNNVQKVISSYVLKNNTLQVINEQYKDSIRILRNTIILMKNDVKTIEKPAITIEKVPVWIYFVGGFIVLFMIILLIIVIKK
jgi:regulator of replication initiation timing